jgi:Zn-dependent peptidase ImmA (M78 family)
MWFDRTEIEHKALQIRREHNIQAYGIKDIFSVIIQRGIDLIRYPFGKGKLLGFAAFFEGKKIIASNSSEIYSREIFTIAHELGHVIYDLDDERSKMKIDFEIEIEENRDDISEERAFHFANCFLMPEEDLRNYIKYELKKNKRELNALDIIRLQLEFQVSYAAMTVRLYEIDLINSKRKSELFDKRDDMTSAALFKSLDADRRLLEPSDVIVVPPKYLEFVTSNYEKGYIPFASLEKAFALIGMDAGAFEKEIIIEEDPDIDDVFEEFIK